MTKQAQTRIVLILACLIVIAGFLAVRQSNAQSPTAAQRLTSAETRLAQVSSYHFTTHTLEIAEAAANDVAARPTERNLHVEGTASRASGQLTMQLWDTAQAVYDVEDAYQVKVEDAGVFGRFGNQAWQTLSLIHI